MSGKLNGQAWIRHSCDMPSFCKPEKLNRILYMSKIDHLNAAGVSPRLRKVQALGFKNIQYCL